MLSVGVCDLRGLTTLEREVPRLVLLRHLGRPSRSQLVTPALFVMMNTTGLNYYLSVREPGHAATAASAGLSATAEVFPVSLSVCPPATVFQMDLVFILCAAVTGLRGAMSSSGGSFRAAEAFVKSFVIDGDSVTFDRTALEGLRVRVHPKHSCAPPVTRVPTNAHISLVPFVPRAGLRVDTRAVRVRISGTAAGAEPVRNPPRRLRRHPRGRRLHRGAAHRLQRSGRQVRSFLLILVRAISLTPCFVIHSVNISTNYVSPGPGGTDVEVDARVTKVGRTLAFMDVTLRTKGGGKVVATGTHCKFLPNSQTSSKL